MSVFLENKEGRLYEVTKLLGDAGINMRALSVAETADYGVVRMIVDRPDEAAQVLKDAGFTVSATDVIGVVVPDRPGGLAEVLKILKDHSVNVEYIYCFVTPMAGKAVDVMRVEDFEKAESILKQHGLQMISQEELF